MQSRLVRKALLFTAAVAVTSLSLGCGGDDETPPVKDKSVTIGIAEPLTSLDPAKTFQTASFELLLNINHPLYLHDAKTLEYKPALAAALPTITEAGTVWEIPLREGLTFADGTAFDASALKYSLDRAMSLNEGAGTLFDHIKNVEKVDDNTVKITLGQAVGFFQALLAMPIFVPANKSVFPADKFLDSPFSEGASEPDWGDSNINQNTVDPSKMFGLGPYIMEKLEYDDSGYTQAVLKANPNFYGAAPKVTNVTIKWYADDAALSQALKDGQIQVGWNTLSNTTLAEFANDENFGLVESNGLIIEYLNLNHRIAPFDNLNLRKAMAYAIDRKAVVDNVFDLTGQGLYTMVPKGMWSHLESFKDQYGADPDLDESKKLLTAEGYDDANKLKFEMWYTTGFADNQPMAEQVKTALEATGMIEVTLKSQDWNAYSNAITSNWSSPPKDHTYPAFWLGWSPDYSHPNTFLDLIYPSSIDLIGISYNDTTLDTLIEEGASAVDFETGKAKYEAIQAQLATDVVNIPVVQRTKVAVTAEGVSVDAPGHDTLMHYATIDAPAPE